jgi:hypothetical protein
MGPAYRLTDKGRAHLDTDTLPLVILLSVLLSNPNNICRTVLRRHMAKPRQTSTVTPLPVIVSNISTLIKVQSAMLAVMLDTISSRLHKMRRILAMDIHL